MWFPLIVVIAQLSAAPAPVQKAYQKLAQTDLDAKKTSARPPASAKKIDVTEKVKSGTPGHKTFLLVSEDGREFWVEFGRSTSAPAQLYGPFPVEEPESTTPPPSTPKPAPKGPGQTPPSK
jgi:hypothetical protein